MYQIALDQASLKDAISTSPKVLNSFESNNIYKLGLIFGVAYAFINIATFVFVFEYWQNMNTYALAISGAHLVAPVFCIALSFYYSSTVQVISYYFSSAVMTLNGMLIVAELILCLMGYTLIQYNDSSFMGEFANALFSNVYIVMIPFTGLTAFLYYEIYRVYIDYDIENLRIHFRRTQTNKAHQLQSQSIQNTQATSFNDNSQLILIYV